ncbi:G/U mismatch-specific DNA glycosylase [bacterium]|nr:MAG: G/U mismatch-specific DNA glycosylase [bacterium]
MSPDHPPPGTWRPTSEQLERAWNSRVEDVIGPGLDLLFVGINPGLWSGAVGHHFAHPSSRFWKAIHRSGFTPRLLTAFEEGELLSHGLGLTNLVDRATAAAKDLSRTELIEGAVQLRRKVRRYRPARLAVLGVGAFRLAFNRPGARVGLQQDLVAGTLVWVLPGPSGLNAHYPMAAAVREFERLRDAMRPG